MILQLVLLEWLMASDHCRSVHGWLPSDLPSAIPHHRHSWWRRPPRRHQDLVTNSPFSGGHRHDQSSQMLHMARKKRGPSGKDGAGAFLDVEFERVVEGRTQEAPTGAAAKKGPVEASVDASSSKSWIEWSLEADPELNSTRIPFFGFRQAGEDDDTNEDDRAFDSIDVKLAFLVELDGETYGIGTPFDHVVALTVETMSKGTTANDRDDAESRSTPSVQNLPPTADNEELMEIMATQLHESVGNDLKLVRTPRVLTVRGPLERYTENWRTDLLPEPLTTEQLLDESDEDVDDFMKFMRRELGDQEVEKTLRGEGTMSADDAELMELFNIPGIGDQQDDGVGIKELLESLLDSPRDQDEEFQKLDPTVLNGQSAAIKLFSYIMPESGKVYSLVSLLQPYVLVAKRVSMASGGIDTDSDENAGASVRFDLLSPPEEELLIPRLERVCQDDLERAGLQLRAAVPEPTSVLDP